MHRQSRGQGAGRGPLRRRRVVDLGRGELPPFPAPPATSRSPSPRVTTAGYSRATPMVPVDDHLPDTAGGVAATETPPPLPEGCTPVETGER